ncbi:MAG: hypothetical protein L0922_02730, partial [Candidatus Mariimomonas ferrooxydans]
MICPPMAVHNQESGGFQHNRPQFLQQPVHPCLSTLPQPSLTPGTPHYLNHHSHLGSTLPQPSLTPEAPHYLNHHS